MKTIYQAPTVVMAEKNLDAFATKWDASHPQLSDVQVAQSGLEEHCEEMDNAYQRLEVSIKPV
jgi:transposase-like protein